MVTSAHHALRLWGLLLGAVFVTSASGAEATSRPAETRNLFGLPAAPLDEPLVTDRPDFTESTDAVPRGRVQLESGYTFTYDREKSDRVHDHTAPEMLWRIGLLEDFELRIGWAGYSWTQTQYEGRTRGGRPVTREDWEDSANDLVLGVKYKFVEQDRFIPHLGAIVEASVPSGSVEATSGDVDPQVKLLWAYDLTDRLALAGNVNLASLTEDAHRFCQAGASVTLALELAERIGSYVEYFGLYPNSRRSDCAHYVNGGFTFLLTDNLQLDVRAGCGLNEEADDFFSGVGFSWRF